jgi:hypothetical protein
MCSGKIAVPPGGGGIRIFITKIKISTKSELNHKSTEGIIFTMQLIPYGNG